MWLLPPARVCLHVADGRRRLGPGGIYLSPDRNVWLGWHVSLGLFWAPSFSFPFTSNNNLLRWRTYEIYCLITFSARCRRGCRFVYSRIIILIIILAIIILLEVLRVYILFWLYNFLRIFIYVYSWIVFFFNWFYRMPFDFVCLSYFIFFPSCQLLCLRNEVAWARRS